MSLLPGSVLRALLLRPRCAFSSGGGARALSAVSGAVRQALAGGAVPPSARPRAAGWPRALAAAPRAPRGARSLFIRVEGTPNPDSLKFSPEVAAGAAPRVVLPERLGPGLHVDKGDAKKAKSCALARRLLAYPDISSVFLGRDFVSVNKREEASWTVRGAAPAQ